uniref:flocculation protein FLO11 isoform X1 n=1 Tax=Solea senegalensis TaxID=28829 RepID=UPI001CD82277|nr:flocculation protein FLO11 isoform X1 [Solea senegalensis]
MQLHACLLLFIITTDKTLVLSLSDCGGDVSVGQEPVGHISLMLPGPFTDTNRLNSVNHQSDKSISNCTWMIDIPLGKSLILKVALLDSGSRISVHCVWNKEDHGQVLERGGTALLSGCDGNKATLTWTGVGHSSNVIQLSYHVQEDERNSSLDNTSPYSVRDHMHSTRIGTSFTSTAPPELVRRTETVRGHLHEGLESSTRLQSVSGPSSLEQDLLHPTSPLQGLSADERGTLPFPEEGPNNGADTSGVAHRTDSPVSATHPYFQHALHTEPSNTETSSSNELPQTQTALTDATASKSSTFIGTGTYKPATSHTVTHSTSQSYHTLSTSITVPITSSPSELPLLTTWENATVLIPHSGTPGESQAHSRRNQRSTDRIISDLTSAITTDPSESPSDPWQDSSGSVHVDRKPTGSSTSSQSHAMTQLSSTSYITESDNAFSSFHPVMSGTGSFESVASDVSSPTALFEPSGQFDDTVKLHTPTASTQSQTNLPQSTGSLTRSPHMSSTATQTQMTTERAQRRFLDRLLTTDTIPSSLGVTTVEGSTSTFTGPSPSPSEALTSAGVVQNSAVTGTTTETSTQYPTYTHELAPTNSPVHPVPSSTFLQQSATTHTHTTDISHNSHTPTSLSSVTESTTMPKVFANHQTEPTSAQTSTMKSASSLTPSHEYISTTLSSLLSFTSARSDNGDRDADVETEDESWQPFHSISSTRTPTAGPPQRHPPWTTPHSGQESSAAPTASPLTSEPTQCSTTSRTPQFYIVPDQPAAVRVESIELLLQIIVEESRSAFTSGLEEDTIAWVEPYLQKAPGFSRLLGVWSSGHAVQSLVEFKASGALHWLSVTGPNSLLERTGLAQAARERRSFRSSKITNITLGGLQGDVCDWLLQCPAGYRCASHPETAAYNCSSACHFDYCHHHGICTHHPGQLPVCRCLVGDDFWYMGQRCDMRMTRARLVGACLAVLLIMVAVIGVLAFVAVRRYRAILIQAKVDQTRSSYRRFNHFDELSGRFWLRSWAGSADSVDNPAFTRSDELLHLRALDRPCCYHDDTLSLASTCPSHGTHINTIYPHSSQYGWRGSGVSMGEGVLDSGKASDLSVCSWPVEPIHWTPFPLLQQLASHRTPTQVRVSRPRSYCEGMELVEMGKSWTA